MSKDLTCFKYQLLLFQPPWHVCFRELETDVHVRLDTDGQRQELLSPHKPPEAVHQLLFASLTFALFKTDDLQKEHFSGTKYLWVGPRTGTGSEARITLRDVLNKYKTSTCFICYTCLNMIYKSAEYTQNYIICKITLCIKTDFVFFHSLLSSITEPTQPQGEGGDPPVYEPTQSSPLAPCEDGCDQDKVEQGGIKRVCFKVNEEDQEDSGHDTMSYRDSYR